MNRLCYVTLGVPLVALLLAGATVAVAQSSASYRLEEAVFNGGGHPSQGTTMASASYLIRLDSLGEAIAGPPMTGPSYQIDSGFSTAYLPPGEVTGLRFDSADTLSWNPERSAGTYNLYRDLLTTIGAGGYGLCYQQGLTTPSATDAEIGASGEGFFYLASAENRVQEEGSKGVDNSGADRGGAVCP